MDKKRKYVTPGVYVEEVSSRIKVISGVSTAVTAFLGRTNRGPIEQPAAVSSTSEFVNDFGPLDSGLPMTQAVADFFANGGQQAVIVRLWNGSSKPDPNQDDAGQPLLNAADFLGRASDRSGLYALLKIDRFNLLCIPPDGRPGTGRESVPSDVWREAAVFCHRRRAFLLVDSPYEWGEDAQTAVSEVQAGLAVLNPVGEEWRSAALFFPRVVRQSGLSSITSDAAAPGGAIAGLFARTDNTRGVWKAPAGIDAVISGFDGLQTGLNAAQRDQLSGQGINILRTLPEAGIVVWGARTLRGAAQSDDTYRYISVRRLAIFLEESIDRGTAWAVFEPNNAALWSSLRSAVEDFLYKLFRAGAFAGTTPEQAFFVRCDSSTMTADDIANGRVNILLGFAPVKPAEFVVVRIQQRTIS